MKEEKENVLEIVAVPTGTINTYKIGDKILNNLEELLIDMYNKITKIERSVA